MLHTKFHENRPAGSGEDFLVVFTIYGRGGHLAIYSCDVDFGIKLSLPLPRDAPHKISV